MRRLLILYYYVGVRESNKLAETRVPIDMDVEIRIKLSASMCCPGKLLHYI